MPEPSELVSLYEGERYFSNPVSGHGESGAGYRDYLANRPEIENKFDRVLNHVERYAEPGRLLDVGAGPGFLVKAAAARGWEARGLDLNLWAAEQAGRLGVEVDVATLVGAALPDAHLDAVTMMDFIEHLPAADSELAEAARVIRPGGVLALLTPDAGSPVTRIAGARWPEVQRAGEHVVLYSVAGLSELLVRSGFEPLGWHSIGKRSSLGTLVADLTPAAPRLGRAAAMLIEGRALAQRRFELDPRAKFCLYARRVEAPHGTAAVASPEAPRSLVPAKLSGELPVPPRLPRKPVAVEAAILEELCELARARRLCDWMFEQYADAVRGAVAEVGAGIGTFSERILAAGAERLLLVEPEPSCAAVLEQRFDSHPRVRIAREELPEPRSLAAGGFDLVVCQNVLEHVGDDAASVAAMAAALAPGGQLTLLVPAHPRLFGPLDETYGHHRRYTRERLRSVVRAAGLEVGDLYPFNLLGVAGWWAKNRRPDSRVGPGSLATYETMLRVWRPLERRLRLPWGLSLVVHARRPSDPAG